MHIHVIGHKGVVGSATYDSLRFGSGYRITGSDKDEKIMQASMYMICTPEDSVVEIAKSLPAGDLIVIRSTMRPDVLMDLEMNGKHFCVNPEFLKAHNAFWDCYFPKSILIGECCQNHGDIVEDIWKFARVPIIRTGLFEASFIKLISNVHAATSITFWNVMKDVADKLSLDIYEVARLLPMIDERVSRYGSFPGQRYSGACLPKDVQQFIDMCEGKISLDWIKYMQERNRTFPDGNLLRGSL